MNLRRELRRTLNPRLFRLIGDHQDPKVILNGLQTRRKGYMNIKTVSQLGFATAFMIGLSSCMDSSMDNMNSTSTPSSTSQTPLAVTYRSAYIAIGAGNRLAIIDMDQMTVRDTLSLTIPPGSTASNMMSDMSNMSSMSGTSGMSMMGMSWPHHLSLSPDSKKIAVAFPGMDLSGGHEAASSGMGGGVALFNATTGALLASVSFPHMNHNAAWSPDGKTVWTSQMMESGKVLILDGSTLARIDSISVGGMPAEITFDADGTKAFVANGMSGTISVIDLTTKIVTQTIKVGSEPVGAWQAMGGHMYVDNEIGKSIYHIHKDSSKVLDSIQLGFTPGMAQMHNASGKLWVSDADNGRIVCFKHDSTGWNRTDSISTGAGAHAISFTKDGSQAWITNQMAGNVSIISTANLQKIKDISVGTKPNGIIMRESP